MIFEMFSSIFYKSYRKDKISEMNQRLENVRMPKRLIFVREDNTKVLLFTSVHFYPLKSPKDQIPLKANHSAVLVNIAT